MATDVIARVIKKGEPYEVLAAQNALDYMRLAGHVPLARAQAIVRGIKFKEPGDRIPKYLLTEAE